MDLVPPSVPDTTELQRLLRNISNAPYVVQGLINFCYLATQSYGIMVGSLLAVFTAQECCPNVPYNICTAASSSTGYLCSMNDEFTGLTKYNIAVLVWNFLTLAIMLTYFGVLWWREKYILKYFIEDPVRNEIAIRDEWSQWPELHSEVIRRSRYSFYVCVVGLAFQFVNIIMSAVLLFGDYYAGTKTAIAFVSNLLIQGGFIFRAIKVSWVDWNYNLSRSILSVEPVSYNSINPKYLFPT